jgi:hypothetical protein
MAKFQKAGAKTEAGLAGRLHAEETQGFAGLDFLLETRQKAKVAGQLSSSAE